MKTLCCVVAAGGILIALPALAQDYYGRGTGSSNIWSSAQGSSDSYGDGKGLSTSSSGSLSNVGGNGVSEQLINDALAIRGITGSAAPITTGRMSATGAVTTSNSVATTNGSGYVQTQTSGYAGGRAFGLAGRAH